MALLDKSIAALAVHAVPGQRLRPPAPARRSHITDAHPLFRYDGASEGQQRNTGVFSVAQVQL